MGMVMDTDPGARRAFMAAQVDDPLGRNLTTSRRVSWAWFLEQISKLPAEDRAKLAQKAARIVGPRLKRRPPIKVSRTRKPE